MRPIVGRIEYLKTFQELCQSGKSEFVAVYGRRRVGKTFLIRNAFESNFTFQVTGLSNASLAKQLTNFNLAMRKITPDNDFLLAKDWLTAFQNLITCLELNSDEKKSFLLTNFHGSTLQDQGLFQPSNISGIVGLQPEMTFC